MSLGRLLAAGKSLMGAREDGGRFRVNKRVQLPKFVSPKNPFTSAEQAAPVQISAPVLAKTSVTRPVATAEKRSVESLVHKPPPTPATKLADKAVRAPARVGAH